MTRFFLKNKVSRPISFTLLLLILSEVIFPTASMALTSGPSQPEVQSFEPISTSDMVDVFSGDFKYNIPLLDVEGYPVNISYGSGISTDQEASWVGLGWNLNVGSVNRSMRGIPDDFKGDIIKKESNMKPNRTFGINAGLDFELFGKEGNSPAGGKKGNKFKLKPSVGVGLSYNNYTGFGVDLDLGVGISAGVGAKGKLDVGLGLHSSAKDGLDISPNISYSNRVVTSEDKEKSLANVTTSSGSFGGSFNTRAGLKNLSIEAKRTKSIEKTITTFGLNPFFMTSGGSPFAIAKSVSTIASKGRSAAGSINFGLQSYVPNYSMPMINNSVALSLKFGASVFGADANVKLSGYYSSQKLAETSKNIESYGYMYSEYGQYNDNAMMDFNREKDGSFSRTTKNLPLTNFTYDVFNVTAQGIGGAYRPFRSDVGHVFDNASYSLSDSYSLGAELGAGNLFKNGVNISIVDVNSNSGKWKNDNEALDYFKFRSNTPNSDFEPYYFKQVGEMGSNPTNLSLYNDLKGGEAYGIRIQQGASNTSSNINSNLPFIKSKKNLERYNYDNSSIVLNPSNNAVAARQKRNQPFVTLSTKEAKNFGLQKDLYNTSVGVKNALNESGSGMAINSNAPDHHIAEISVLNADGSRYYYGLPAYNLKSKEVSFTIAQVNEQKLGLVPYTAVDASLDNDRGIDGNYNMTETPAYAYSHLLTAVVSADYVDMNNNGPDDADNGTYTKFHYSRSQGVSSNDYQWRIPTTHCANLANYNENSKSKVEDNSANYSYGKKEIWFLDEIETKNYIAKFILSDRKDAYGAQEDGTIDTQGPKSKKIDRIILYSKPEYLANPNAAVPIKTVHFEYSYDLCKGNVNCSSPSALFKLANNSYAPATGNEMSNNGGKLTLERIYFTYGKSNRAKFNQYQFTYAENPDYHPKAYDRWGNYKPVSGVINYAWNATQITNSEFPYVEQNKTTADQYSKAWTLSKIKLPSGGEINIDYESDDYAFVQNMPAAQMFKVVGAVSGNTNFSIPGTPLPTTLNELYTSLGSNNLNLIIDVGTTSNLTDQEFVKYYLKDISENNKQLFFKFLVNLTSPTAQSPNFYEYVSGYADVEPNGGGLIKDGSGNPTGKAWIKIKQVNIKRKGTSIPQTNPISLAAAQFGRMNYGAAVWDNNFTPPDDVEEALKQMAVSAKGALKTLITGFKDPNKALIDKGYCKLFQPDKSIIRLYSPTGKKLGGGSRVKKLAIKDNWDVMTTQGGNSQDASEYGQEYTYTTTDEFNNTISSGVASYEPMIGGEENSLKQPFYLGKNKWAVLAPDDRYYVEGPFGESFYPSPNVGYSKVKVTSLVPPTAPSTFKNGYKVYEFYTAKDYPTICKHTPIMPKQYRSPLKTILKISSKDLVSASQGYVIITNDMHGKPKAEYDYAEGKTTPEKETRFYYKTRNGFQEPTQRGLYTDASYSGNELYNACTVINKEGNVNTSVIGIDFDAVADFRESETETKMISSQNNASTFIVGLVPALIPTIWPSAQYELSRFRSAVLTKVVNQYGILEKTEVRIDKSLTVSETLAYDEETGEAIVSKTMNEFNDPIYNIKYPAHWGYQFMGGAYKNVGMVFNGSYSSAGNYAISNANLYLNVGDELGLSTSSVNQRVWVCGTNGNSATLMDENGNAVTVSGTVSLKVLRSARRNQISTPMQVLTALVNPLPGSLTTNQPLNISASSKILNASGVQYSDQWQIAKGKATDNCNCTSIPQTGVDLINFIKTLFNKKNNASDVLTSPLLSPAWTGGPVNSYYTNAFLNGVIPTPMQNDNVNISPVSIPNQTYIWKDPNSGLTYSYPMNSSILNAGFGASSPMANNNNYGFTNNLMTKVPYVYGSGNAAEVLWFGPGYGSGNPFNSNNQLIGMLTSKGSFIPDESRACAVILDFGPNFSWSTTLQAQLAALAQSPVQNIVDIVPKTNQTSCIGDKLDCDFIIKNQYQTIIYSWPITISSPCMTGYLTASCTQNGGAVVQCGKKENDKVNPYFQGIRGNWRIKSNYSYLTDRIQNISSAANGLNTDIRNDGYFATFASLYTANSGNDWTFTPGSSGGNNKWVNSVQTTKYNTFGTEIETKDALGRYSSALYGYNEAYPVATAANAQLQEIAYDGFEDYAFYPAVCKREHHFDFYSNIANLSSSEAHTGKYSMNVAAGQTISEIRSVVTPGNYQTANYPACSYILKPVDFIYPFTPYSNSEYVVSYWSKETYTGSKPQDYTTNQLTVTQGSGAPFTIKNMKRSAIIDGWQRTEYVFVIPSYYTGAIKVNLKNTGANTVYFDDIRLHPVKSIMKTYVYHPVTLKYVAELDANNFATFYEYDDQGNLIRVKKETERGIMTIKESKTHYFKQ